jgi:hypothetical protein
VTVDTDDFSGMAAPLQQQRLVFSPQHHLVSSPQNMRSLEASTERVKVGIGLKRARPPPPLVPRWFAGFTFVANCVFRATETVRVVPINIPGRSIPFDVELVLGSQPSTLGYARKKLARAAGLPPPDTVGYSLHVYLVCADGPRRMLDGVSARLLGGADGSLLARLGVVGGVELRLERKRSLAGAIMNLPK